MLSLTCEQENVYVCAWSPLAHVWGSSFDEETFFFWDSVFFEGNKTWKSDQLVILTIFYFSIKTQRPWLNKTTACYLERDRRRREREWERERWCGLSLLMSRSLSRERSGSSFFWGFSGEASLTSFTDSTFFTSTTVSLQGKETPLNS